ncbi:ammonia-forming cytochrome c nitrite reductase subunit c552 [Anaerobacillus sp. HL2]|nr:ammonia-forming cytochrome c nitrite reductase subunit c552 [Anaerobacillus sp. HL2]
MPFERDDKKENFIPLLGASLETVEQSCRACHSDKTKRISKIGFLKFKERHIDALHESEEITDAHYYINRMITAGVSTDKVKQAQDFVREGQWLQILLQKILKASIA